MRISRFKLPKDASTCEECIYYSKLTKMCMKYKVKIDDPKMPKCKPPAYFRYYRLTAEDLDAEICLPDERLLAEVLPRTHKVKIGDMLDVLERYGCKPYGVKRVDNVVTLYLSCACKVRASIKCSRTGCIYQVVS